MTENGRRRSVKVKRTTVTFSAPPWGRLRFPPVFRRRRERGTTTTFRRPSQRGFEPEGPLVTVRQEEMKRPDAPVLSGGSGAVHASCLSHLSKNAAQF